MTRLSRARWLELRTEESRDHAWAEHRRLLDLIRRREADAAAHAVCEHIRETRDRLLASLEEDRRSFKARGFAIVGRA